MMSQPYRLGSLGDKWMNRTIVTQYPDASCLLRNGNGMYGRNAAPLASQSCSPLPICRGRSCTRRGSSTAALSPVYSSPLDDTTSVILLSVSLPLEFLVFCTLLRFVGGFDSVVFPSPVFSDCPSHSLLS
jgi:hypothetical protein